jgi:hypothetical protein
MLVVIIIIIVVFHCSKALVSRVFCLVLVHNLQPETDRVFSPSKPRIETNAAAYESASGKIKKHFCAFVRTGTNVITVQNKFNRQTKECPQRTKL